MPMADTEIKQTLAAMLGKADKRKGTALGWFATFSLVLSVAACGEMQAALSDELGWSGGAAFIVSLGVAIAIFALVMYFDELLNARRTRRLADTFREVFGKDKHDNQKAVALLHAAKTKQKVEKDLLKALGITSDVEFQSSKPTDVVKVIKTSGPAAKGGLLGDFEPGGATTDPSAAPGGQEASEFVPLDPYAAPNGDGGTDTKH